MTFEQAFLKIKEKFENSDASNISDFAIQVTFMDEDCNGKFYAQVKDGALYVEPYDYRDNSLAITITKSALLAYLGGRSTMDKALDSGDAYVESGDISKMADWKNTIKKAPVAKKAPDTKAPVKAEAKKAAPVKKAEVKTAAPKEVPAKKTETKTAPKTIETKTTTKTTASKSTTTKTASKKTK
ncbi:MAG: alkyl sulfatase C-terminal domain-containing protein [Hominilimicola sp.]